MDYFHVNVLTSDWLQLTRQLTCRFAPSSLCCQMCHHSLLFGSDSPGLFALRKLSHPPTTEASLKCVCVLSWMDVLSLLCEDEPKAMLTIVIVKGDWSLCTCVEVLVFG